VFSISGCDIRRGNNRRHCSEECRRPIVFITCKTCGGRFKVSPSAMNRRQFCCFACYRRSNAETSIEKTIRLSLESLGIPFEQEARIGRYSIDFLLRKQHIALEVDGNYWHRDRHRDARKTRFLAKHGWDVVRISETDVNNAVNVDVLVANSLESVNFA